MIFGIGDKQHWKKKEQEDKIKRNNKFLTSKEKLGHKGIIKESHKKARQNH